MRHLNTKQSLILLTLLIIFGFFVSQDIQATSCPNIPLAGTTTITASCAFAGTVNGVEQGNLIIKPGATLTINNGQTVAWNPGFSIIIEKGNPLASIAINKGSPGGQIRKTYLWLTDGDNDNYPSSLTQIAQNNQPPNGRRRKDFTNFTYVSDIVVDTNDSNDCVDTVTRLCCDATNPTDGLRPPKTAGQHGCGACKYCTGSSIDCANVPEDTDPYGSCTGNCDECDGLGACRGDYTLCGGTNSSCECIGFGNTFICEACAGTDENCYCSKGICVQCPYESDCCSGVCKQRRCVVEGPENCEERCAFWGCSKCVACYVSTGCGMYTDGDCSVSDFYCGACLCFCCD